jgi:beta-lactamase regulating signal transducer with metallopeptidase domain
MIALAAAGPLLIGVALSGFADRIGRRLPPRSAVCLLTALALTVALSTGLVLSAAAVLVSAQIGPIPRLGHWSATAVRAASGVPIGLGVIAALVVSCCLLAAIVQLERAGAALVRASRAAKLMEPNAGDLVVVDDAVPIAYTVAAMRGPIVVSTSMLRALSVDERRVLVTHERSHVRHHHYLYLHLVRLAASANPLLRPVTPVVAREIERWADEDAAAQVGDRDLAARAVARAALARAGHPLSAPDLAAADDHVVERTRLLLAPPQQPTWILAASLVAVGVASWVAAATVTLWTHNVIELGEAVYTRH